MNSEVSPYPEPIDAPFEADMPSKRSSTTLNRSLAEARIALIQGKLDHPVTIRLIDHFSDFPAEVRADAAEKGIPGTAVKGVYSDGEVLIQAGAIKDMDDLEQSIHEELYGHYGFHQYFGENNRQKMADLYQAIGGDQGFRALCDAYNVDLSDYAAALRDSPRATRESILAEELLAHLASTRNPTVKGRLSALYGGIRQWWRDNGFGELPMYSEADIDSLLHKAHKAATHGRPQELGSLSDYDARHVAAKHTPLQTPTGDPLVQFWKSMALEADVFELPSSDRTELEAIVAEHEGDLGHQIERDDALALDVTNLAESGMPDKAWRITAPDGSESKVYELGDQVWIDVSQLRTGQQGRRVYNAVANYAVNNNLTFIGDPNGLTEVAVSRRLENMVSSALKFGTTRHLSLHQRQVEGNIAVPPVDWIEGNDDYNLHQMIRASLESITRQVPDIENLAYNVPTGEFIWSDTNEPLSAEKITALVTNLRESHADRRARHAFGADGRTGSPFTVGRKTLERAVLSLTFLRGTSEERSELLAHTCAKRSKRLNGILYSLSTDRSDWGQAPTRTQPSASSPPSGKVSSPTQARVMPVNWADDYLHPAQGSLFQFAGSRSATADQLALAAAQQFDGQGYDPEQIRQKTGWFRGEDQQWRYEISDHESTLKSDRLRPVGGIDLAFNGSLGDILDHPRLFAAYPHLAQLPVSFTLGDRFTRTGAYLSGGEFGNGLELPTIIIKANEVEDLHQCLLHEIQHGIQEIEGFGLGTDPATVRKAYSVSLESRRGELEKRQEHLERTPEKSPFQERELNLIVRDLEVLDNALLSSQGKAFNEAFYWRYQDHAGEREARMTAESKDLTPLQRATRLPFKERINGRKPIVVFNDTTMKEMATHLEITPKADVLLLPKQSLMRLTHAVDRSSFLHESAHVFLHMEAKTSRGRELDSTQRKIAHYLDVPDLQNVTRQHQEKFARDFEKYLRERQKEDQRPRGMSAVFGTVKQWLQGVYKGAEDLGEPLSPSAREVFEELMRDSPPRDYASEKSLERHEQSVAMKLYKTGLYEKGDCYTNAKMIGAYALAKVDRDPNYPTLDRVFDHMNLEIVRADVSDLKDDIQFDWDTFDLDTTVRRHQCEVRAARATDLGQYDLSRLQERLEKDHSQSYDTTARSMTMGL